MTSKVEEADGDGGALQAPDNPVFNWQSLYACTFPCSESRMSLSMPAIEATGLFKQG